MHIVIDIPEGNYKAICETKNVWEREPKQIIYLAIANGTPLPKGHGKLVDLDQMCEDYWDGNYMEIHFNDLDNIKTIIEADKAESEDKCKGCEYYLNPDYTRCHECKAESEEQE